MKGMIGDLTAQVEDLRNERDYMLQYVKTEASKAEDVQEMLTKLQLEKIQQSKEGKDGEGGSDQTPARRRGSCHSCCWKKRSCRKR